MLENSVRTINESFICRFSSSETPPCTTDESYEAVRASEGITQDHHARYYNQLVVKIAGNMHCGEDDEACPYTLNSLCVGSTTHVEPPEQAAATMSCFSTWRNPGTHWQPNGLPVSLYGDREEPDLTAFGGNRNTTFGPCQGGFTQEVETLDPNGGTNDWDGDSGTSFAAPSVTSIAALTREACAPFWGSPLDARFLRSLLRTAAWGGNPDGDWRYSTPVPTWVANSDRKDGAGMLLASGAIEFCGEGPLPDGGTGGGWFPVDLTNGGPMPGSTSSDYQGNNYIPPGGADYYPVPPPTSGPDARVGQLLWTSPPSLDAGARIRFTLSWDSCATDPSGDAPASLPVDFDLFLVNVTTDEIVYGSQSIDDNNEGFDVILTEDSSDYEVWMNWPETSTSGCEGAGLEPIGWTVRYWTQT